MQHYDDFNLCFYKFNDYEMWKDGFNDVSNCQDTVTYYTTINIVFRNKPLIYYTLSVAAYFLSLWHILQSAIYYT